MANDIYESGEVCEWLGYCLTSVGILAQHPTPIGIGVGFYTLGKIIKIGAKESYTPREAKLTLEKKL